MHFMAFREKVDQGDDDESKESGRGEAADKDDAHGLAEFCACAYAESDGEHAQKCGKGGHEDGAQPEGAGFQYGIFQRHAPCSCPVGVVDEENGIFCDKSQEHGKTDEGHHVGCLVCCEEAEDCTLVKALCQILGITLENLKKLGDNQSQTERILLEAFQEGMRSLGHNFDYIFNEQRLLAANG